MFHTGVGNLTVGLIHIHTCTVEDKIKFPFRLVRRSCNGDKTPTCRWNACLDHSHTCILDFLLDPGFLEAHQWSSKRLRTLWMLYVGHSSFKSLINISERNKPSLYSLCLQYNSAQVKLRQSHSHKAKGKCRLPVCVDFISGRNTNKR